MFCYENPKDDFNKNKKIKITTIEPKKSSGLVKRRSSIIMSPLSKIQSMEDKKSITYNEFLLANNLNPKSLFANRFRPIEEIKQDL